MLKAKREMEKKKEQKHQMGRKHKNMWCRGLVFNRENMWISRKKKKIILLNKALFKA